MVFSVVFSYCDFKKNQKYYAFVITGRWNRNNIVFNVYTNHFNIEFCASTLRCTVNSLVFLSLLQVCLAYLISMFNLYNI